MMLQNVNIALSVVLCGCLLSGCNNSTTSASSSVSSPSTSDYESSSVATSNLDSYEDEEPTSAVPSSTQPPTEGTKHTRFFRTKALLLRSRNRNIPTFPFLSEEQRQLYTNAYDASFGLYGEGANLMDKWGYKVVTDGSDSVPFIEDHYTLYNVSFDEFSSAFIVYLPITA